MDILKQLEVAANRAYTRGIQTGNGGNLSARTDDGKMIVKSSGGSFADCTSAGEGFVKTDFDGNVLPGEAGKPTREVFLHGLMYRLTSAGGVMHTHSPYSIAWSYGKKSLPMRTLHVQLKMGCEIPVIDVDSASVQPRHAAMIGELFAENPKLAGFILVGHGIVALGKDVLEAEHNAELIEETAQITILKGLCEKNGLY